MMDRTRAAFHSNAVAILESRTYHGEVPRRVAAFPIAISPFAWNGIVETDSALHQIQVNAPGVSFNPDAAFIIHKPEASPLLDTARDDLIAQAFLKVARFPRATVEKTEEGCRVEIQDLRYAAAGPSKHDIAALFEFDSAGKIVYRELIWVRDRDRGRH